MVVARPRTVALVALLALVSTQTHAAALQARLSAPLVRAGEEVTLHLRAEANGTSETPDLSPLEKDFEVLGSQQSHRLSIVNGRRESSVDWVITLLPRRLGEIVVPSLHAGAAVSRSLRLEVTETEPAQQRSDRPDLFVESTVDQISPYVQSEVRYTVKVYDGIGIQEGTLTEPDVGDAHVTPMGEGRVYEETIDGRSYQVHEREYVIRPQASGHLAIGPVTLQARVRDPNARRRSPFGDAFGGSSFFRGLDPFAGMGGRGSSLFDRMMNPGRPIRTRSNAIELEVQSRPESAGQGWFLPAKQVELRESFEPAISSLRVGEALTRKIELRAVGASPEQLPELSILAPSGVRQYSEGSRKGSVPTADGMVAVREETVALVPSKAGWVEFPAVEVHWWDTTHETKRKATIPGRRVEVLAAPGAVQAQSPQSAPAQALGPEEEPASLPAEGRLDPTQTTVLQDPPWLMWLGGSAILLVGAGAGLVLILRRRRRLADGTGEGIAGSGDPAREIEKACRDNDAVRVREQFLAWARLRLGSRTPASPRAIALRLGDENLAAELAKLDRSIYAPDARAFEGSSFWNAFRCANRLGSRGERADAPTILPGLYPSV